MRPLPRRRNISADLVEHLRDLIVRGELAAGQRVNEVQLAVRFEVSRTPLREAMSQLVSEGFVVIRPRRGFFVQELGPEEVEGLYTIRAILDPAALELAGLPSEAQIHRLRKLNESIAASRGRPSRIIELDDRWHVELLSHCRSRPLLDLIRQHMRRVRAFEYAYMREHANVSVVVAEHSRILDALAAGNLRAAVGALRRNMKTAVPPLLEWARARPRTEEKVHER